jgi:RNA polymerase sigma-70 factor (ECF subfamily)
MTRDLPLAEELTQETFLRAGRGLREFRGEAKLATWLYRIATNLYLDHRRREASRADSGAPIDPADVVDVAGLTTAGPALPDRLFEDSDMGQCIRGFVDRLSPERRAVIVLHDLQELKNREIAEILGCTLETVKIRIHRARRELRELLSDGCEFYYDERDVLRCDRRQPGEEGPC